MKFNTLASTLPLLTLAGSAYAQGVASSASAAVSSASGAVSSASGAVESATGSASSAAPSASTSGGAEGDYLQQVLGALT